MITQGRYLFILIFWASVLIAEPSGTVPPVAEPAPASQSITPVPSPNLESLLKATLKQNGMIQEANQDIEIARSQIELARSALFPKASATILGAPMPEVRGDTNSSKVNLGKWGP